MERFFFHNIRIALDLDEVLVDFLGGFSKWVNKDYNKVKNFDFAYGLKDIISTLPDDFWVDLPAKIKSDDLNFLPVAYITKRSFDEDITQRWIEKNGFPCSKVIHVREHSKLTACKQENIDIYVDDYIQNFQDLNSNGVTTFLMDAEHNRQFDVGEFRLHHIRELTQKIEKITLSNKSINCGYDFKRENQW